jgi:hypothetical protein
MAELDLEYEENGVVVKVVPPTVGSTGAARGVLPGGRNLLKVKEILGDLTREFVEALDPTKKLTKEITLEMAFELTNTFDLKIVDLHGSAALKVIVKI